MRKVECHRCHLPMKDKGDHWECYTRGCGEGRMPKTDDDCLSEIRAAFAPVAGWYGHGQSTWLPDMVAAAVADLPGDRRMSTGPTHLEAAYAETKAMRTNPGMRRLVDAALALNVYERNRLALRDLGPQMVKYFCEQTGKNQTEAAGLIEVSAAFVSRLANGKEPLSVDMAAKMAYAISEAQSAAKTEKVCSCPSVACELHGLPAGSACGGW